jgi:short-subunit dehydrogenase
MKDLRNRRALLTGGSRGIGPIIGRALVNAGVNLALVARSADKLAAVAQELRGLGGHVIALPADLTDPAAQDKLIKRIEAELGPLDILINNAAIEQVSHFAQQPPPAIRAVIETNLIAPLLLTRRVLPGMLARHSGHIVNIASIAGKKAPPFNAVYGATKSALIEWTGALRSELAGSGVSASVVCPGFISQTGMFVENYGGQPAPRLIGQVSPQAVARAVVRALQQDTLEVLVAARPVRPLLALYALWPGLGHPFLKWTGVTALFRRAAERNQASAGETDS